mgnify:FL=1
MNKSGFVVGVTALGLMVSVSASGSDDVSDFEGPYIGASISKSKGEILWENTGDIYDFDHDTVAVAGVFAGYNTSILDDGLIAGVEAAYAPGKVIYTSATVSSTTGRKTYDIYNSLDLNVRLGKSIKTDGGAVMPYITSGYSRVDIDTKKVACGASSGHNYGVGMEYQSNSEFFVGLGYLKRDGFSVPVSNQACVTSNGFDGETEALQLRLGTRF